MSKRTEIRDAVIAHLTALAKTDAARVKDFIVSPRYLHEGETKGTTYCVVVTDESPSEKGTQTEAAFAVTLKLILYARHATDPRAVLDACIEDVYEAIKRVEQTVQPTRQWALQELTTDEGTTEALPWAQAVMHWTVLISRTRVPL